MREDLATLGIALAVGSESNRDAFLRSTLAAVTISGISKRGPITVASAAAEPTPNNTIAVPIATSNWELELIMAVIAVSS